MKTKNKIEKQLRKKTNPELVNTIIAAKKQDEWLKIASILSGPRSNRVNLNLNELNKKVKNGEKIIVPGKILSLGEFDKKIKIAALSFSEKAKEKLLKSKSEILTILEEIKKNPKAKDLKILKNEKNN